MEAFLFINIIHSTHAICIIHKSQIPLHPVSVVSFASTTLSHQLLENSLHEVRHRRDQRRGVTDQLRGLRHEGLAEQIHGVLQEVHDGLD